MLEPRSLSAWVEASRAARAAGVELPMMHHERVVDDALMVMFFDGATPPERSDFHINSSPEFFYQIDGDMRCRVLEAGGFRDVIVGPGEIFYLPPLVPHLNTRVAGSIGLVIHQRRPPGVTDAIVWYCQVCAHQLHRVDYLFTDLRAQLKAHISAFLADETLRTCDRCGALMPADLGRMR